MSGDGRLLLAASPYLRGEALIDVLLQIVFERACCASAEAPRTRNDFEAAVDRGRELLYGIFDAVMAEAAGWFAEARAVRSLLDDPRARLHAPLVEASAGHLHRLLHRDSMFYKSKEYGVHLPRYIRGEKRRWERLLARGGEPSQIGPEIEEWEARSASLAAQIEAELRWLPQLDEFRAAIEEYRISLYAQELRAAVPVSAARLKARAADLAAWITR